MARGLLDPDLKVQVYLRYIAMKILIFVLPGSGKTTLASKLGKKIGGTHLNADVLREQLTNQHPSHRYAVRSVF